MSPQTTGLRLHYIVVDSVSIVSTFFGKDFNVRMLVYFKSTVGLKLFVTPAQVGEELS